MPSPDRGPDARPTADPAMTADPRAAAGAAPWTALAATARPTVVIVMPAYNAAKTLERTYADIPHDIVERIILVDDVSVRRERRSVARQLGLGRDHSQPEPRVRRKPEDVL